MLITIITACRLTDHIILPKDKYIKSGHGLVVGTNVVMNILLLYYTYVASIISLLDEISLG